MAISYLSGGRIQGLSSDTKPTNVPLQSLFEETDTGKFFTLLYATSFASASWIEMGTGGVITQNTALNSSLVTGGMVSGGNSVYDTTETFSGGTWSASHDLLRDRYAHAGGGNSTAALIAGGSKADGGWANLSSTEKLVSGSWASDVAFAEERYYCSGGGSRTNFLICHGNAGSDAPTYNRTHSWEFNGTSWANSAAIGWECYASNMGGNATAAVCFGGQVTGYTATESAKYDGSSWTSSNALNQARYIHGGDGTSTNAIAYHGYDGSASTNRTTETFDGTSWTSRGQSSLSAYSRYGAMACGTGSAAVMGMGKANSVYLNSTEIWDGSAFATTGNAVSAREYSAGGYA